MKFLSLFFLGLLLSANCIAKYAEPNVLLSDNPIHELSNVLELENNRSPANKFPTRVFAFTCRSIEDFEMHAIGLVKQSMPIRKADRSDFAMTLYVKKGSRDYLTQTLNGSSTTVPEGMILRAKTSILKNEVVLFHFHPNDNTKLPGVDDELECRITGLLESQ